MGLERDRSQISREIFKSAFILGLEALSLKERRGKRREQVKKRIDNIKEVMKDEG